jgi:hypothetical protein
MCDAAWEPHFLTTIDKAKAELGLEPRFNSLGCLPDFYESGDDTSVPSHSAIF